MHCINCGGSIIWDEIENQWVCDDCDNGEPDDTDPEEDR
jgi:reverse gyrase